MFKQVHDESALVASAKIVKDAIKAYKESIITLQKELDTLLSRQDIYLEIKTRKGRRNVTYKLFPSSTPQELAQRTKDKEDLIEFLFKDIFKSLAKSSHIEDPCLFQNIIAISELVEPSLFKIIKVEGETSRPVLIELSKDRIESINKRRKRYGFEPYEIPAVEKKEKNDE